MLTHYDFLAAVFRDAFVNDPVGISEWMAKEGISVERFIPWLDENYPQIGEA